MHVKHRYPLLCKLEISMPHRKINGYGHVKTALLPINLFLDLTKEWCHHSFSSLPGDLERKIPERIKVFSWELLLTTINTQDMSNPESMPPWQVLWRNTNTEPTILLLLLCLAIYLLNSFEESIFLYHWFLVYSVHIISLLVITAISLLHWLKDICNFLRTWFSPFFNILFC